MSPDPRRNVLVTSIARKVPLLQAIRASLPRGVEVHGADADPDALGRYFVDGFWAMPADGDLTLEAVVDHARRHAVGLIVPTRDAELPFWAAHAARLAAAGIAVLVSPPSAIATCRDKLAFAAKLLDAGEPAIPTSAAPEGAGPFVVKEREGAGGGSVAVGLAHAEALAYAATLAEPVFQPFVAGVEHSVDVYATAAGAVHGVVARRREVVVGGESHVTATVRDPALEALAARVAVLLGLRGPAVLQIIVAPDGGHHVVECNPRVGGASTLSIAAGLDVFGWARHEARAEPLGPFARRPGELRQVRAMHDTRFPAEHS